MSRRLHDLTEDSENLRKIRKTFVPPSGGGQTAGPPDPPAPPPPPPQKPSVVDAFRQFLRMLDALIFGYRGALGYVGVAAIYLLGSVWLPKSPQNPFVVVWTAIAVVAMLVVRWRTNLRGDLRTAAPNAGSLPGAKSKKRFFRPSLITLLTIAVILAGAFAGLIFGFLPHVTNVTSTPPLPKASPSTPGCSAEVTIATLTTLMRTKVLPDVAAANALGIPSRSGTDLMQTKVSFDAFRTRSTEGGIVNCAVDFLISYPHGNLTAQGSLYFTVEMTDDGRPYVSIMY